MDRDQMREIAEAQATVADKIRALASAGVARADIARFLGKRYQHVRNVLEADAQTGAYVVGRADLSGVHESAAAFRADQQEVRPPEAAPFWRLTLGPEGKLAIPSSVMEAMGWRPEGVVIAELEPDRIVLLSTPASIRRVQEMVRELLPQSKTMAEELIADRRREAERENG